MVLRKPQLFQKSKAAVANSQIVDVPREERWAGTTGLEAPMGTLMAFEAGTADIMREF